MDFYKCATIFLLLCTNLYFTSSYPNSGNFNNLSARQRRHDLEQRKLDRWRLVNPGGHLPAQLTCPGWKVGMPCGSTAETSKCVNEDPQVHPQCDDKCLPTPTDTDGFADDKMNPQIPNPDTTSTTPIRCFPNTIATIPETYPPGCVDTNTPHKCELKNLKCCVDSAKYCHGCATECVPGTTNPNCDQMCTVGEFCTEEACCNPPRKCPENCIFIAELPRPEPPEETPYADIWKAHNEDESSGILYNQPCNYYGNMHQYDQEDRYKTSPNRGPDSKLSKIAPLMCKLSHRLECIPTFGFPQRTSNEEFALDSDGEVIPYLEPSDESPGFCRCMRELSDRAIYIEGNEKDIKPGCYIPAGFDDASTCGHIVALPYGEINTVEDDPRYPGRDRRVVRRTIGDTSKMCVPNSKCRHSGSGKYDGLRCQCDKKTKHIRETGTCELIYRKA